MITVKDLQEIAGARKPSALMVQIAEAMNRHAPKYGVTTAKRIAEFLANISVETGGFTRLDENLNYSAKRLRQVWPARFPDNATARKYANNPQALANYVYGSRLGNRGKPNAGWLYRGSGPGQTTGYDNFLTAEKATGIPFTSQPDLMRDPDKGLIAALTLWRKWGLNDRADRGETDAIRKRWNGGTHGLAEVRAARGRAIKLNLHIEGKPAPDPVIAPPVSDSKPFNNSQKPAGVPGALPGAAVAGGGLLLALWAKWGEFTTWLGSMFQ